MTIEPSFSRAFYLKIPKRKKNKLPKLKKSQAFLVVLSYLKIPKKKTRNEIKREKRMDPKLKITRKRITQINKLMPRYRCSFFFTRKQTVRIIVTENYPLIIKFLNLSTTRLAQPLFSLISLSDVRRRILFLFIPRGDERQK